MNVLLTAGPTREYFDTVRFISNGSTGKLGYAIAREFRQRGHAVTLVSGPTQLADPDGVDVIRVETAQEMLDACMARFDRMDLAVMTAAVCDYRPAERSSRKVAKGSGPVQIELVPNPDICAILGKAKRVDQRVIGFAMEDHDHRAHAEAKLRRKNCDGIVLNGVTNVAVDEGAVEFLAAGGAWSGPATGRKDVLAARVVDFAERLVSGGAI